MFLPLDFKYATTVGFWLSIMTLFLQSTLIGKIFNSYSFGISTCGILMQLNKKYEQRKSLIKNIIHYIIPLLISLSMCFINRKKYDITYKVFIPIILYHIFTKIININLNKQYQNYQYYRIIALVLILVYFKFM